MASPWEQPPSALSREKKGVTGRWWWKIHHLSYHPGKPTCREESNQCKIGAAFPRPYALYLTNLGGAGGRLEWAASPELPSTCSTLLPGPYICISLYMYIHAHTCTHIKRGPCNFHVEQGEGSEGKKW